MVKSVDLFETPCESWLVLQFFHLPKIGFLLIHPVQEMHAVRAMQIAIAFIWIDPNRGCKILSGFLILFIVEVALAALMVEVFALRIEF